MGTRTPAVSFHSASDSVTNAKRASRERFIARCATGCPVAGFSSHSTVTPFQCIFRISPVSTFSPTFQFSVPPPANFTSDCSRSRERKIGSSIATRRNAAICDSSRGCSPCAVERLKFIGVALSSAGLKQAVVHHASSFQALSTVKVRLGASRISSRTLCTTLCTRSFTTSFATSADFSSRVANTTISFGHAASARSQRRAMVASSIPR